MAELFLGVEAGLENTFSNFEASGTAVAAGTFRQREKPLPVQHRYAVEVRSRQEKVVTRHLEYQGMDYFLPVPGPLLATRARSHSFLVVCRGLSHLGPSKQELEKRGGAKDDFADPLL